MVGCDVARLPSCGVTGQLPEVDGKPSCGVLAGTRGAGGWKSLGPEDLELDGNGVDVPSYLLITYLLTYIHTYIQIYIYIHTYIYIHIYVSLPISLSLHKQHVLDW